MLSPEKSHPEYFEELCALAASGQISEPEFVELQDHLQHCADCRSTYADFVDLLHNKLLLAAPELMGPSKLAGFFPGNFSYRERFLTRARKQGLAVSHRSLRYTLGSKCGIWLLEGAGYAQIFALAIALLLVAVGILGYSLRQSNARYTALTADMAAMRRQIDRRDRPAPSLAQENGPRNLPAQTDTSPPFPTPPIASPSNTDQDVVRVQQDLLAAEARAKALQEQQQASVFELQAARAQFSDAVDSRNQLESKLAEDRKSVV